MQKKSNGEIQIKFIWLEFLGVLSKHFISMPINNHFSEGNHQLTEPNIQFVFHLEPRHSCFRMIHFIMNEAQKFLLWLNGFYFPIVVSRLHDSWCLLCLFCFIFCSLMLALFFQLCISNFSEIHILCILQRLNPFSAHAHLDDISFSIIS